MNETFEQWFARACPDVILPYVKACMATAYEAGRESARVEGGIRARQVAEDTERARAHPTKPTGGEAAA